jgi:hypothetical protein
VSCRSVRPILFLEQVGTGYSCRQRPNAPAHWPCALKGLLQPTSLTSFRWWSALRVRVYLHQPCTVLACPVLPASEHAGTVATDYWTMLSVVGQDPGKASVQDLCSLPGLDWGEENPGWIQDLGKPGILSWASCLNLGPAGACLNLWPWLLPFRRNGVTGTDLLRKLRTSAGEPGYKK